MPRYGRLLSDAQWEKIRPLLPKSRRHPRGGRPRANSRKVLHLAPLRERKAARHLFQGEATYLKFWKGLHQHRLAVPANQEPGVHLALTLDIDDTALFK
jgi:hypothetical protein